MLVIQNLWSQWTKSSRDAAAARPRLLEALPLPTPVGPPPPGQAWIHDVRRREDEGFELRTWSGWATQDDWSRMRFTNTLAWALRAGGVVEVTLRPPSPNMRQTRWPDGLASPLYVLKPGETARILWNGRFRNSLFGSNRGSFYEEHLTLVAAANDPGPALFTAGSPDHAIDLTTRIY